MKNLRSLAALAAVALLVAGWFLWQSCVQVGRAATYQFISGQIVAPVGLGQFELNRGIKRPTDLDPSDPQAWKVFFSLGDGQWWMGDSSDFALMQFQYYRTGSFEAFADLTSTYDDDDFPTGLFRAPIVTVGSGDLTASAPVEHPLGTGRSVKMFCNRQPKAMDSLIYVVTYQPKAGFGPNGRLDFTYNPAFLKLLAVENFFSEEDVSTVQTEISAQDGKVEIPFTGLGAGSPGQRSIFFRFEVLADASTHVGQTMAPNPKVVLNLQEGAGLKAVDDYTLSDQVIVNAHDPNTKACTAQKVCLTDQFAEFTVTFQNTGTGPAKDVVVEDELDKHLDPNYAPTVTRSTGNKMPVVAQVSGSSKYRFTFSNLNLKGTHQQGFGTKFGEDSTMHTFSFRAKIATQAPCDGIVNRARIFFGCNPAVETNHAVAPFSCDSVCGGCIDTVLLHLLVPDIVEFNKPMGDIVALDNLTNSLDGQGYSFHWYPPSDFDDCEKALPIYRGTYNNRFTLVVSKACKRLVYSIVARSPCQLNITIDESKLDKSCYGQTSDTLIATVTGAANPKWGNASCSPHDTAIYMITPGQTEVLIGVTDEATGCSKEVLFPIGPPSIQIYDDPTDCEADLVITGGTGAYSVVWSYTRNDNTTGSATGLWLDLVDKKSATATVTDGNNCTKLFRPLKAGCTSPIPWLWYTLIAAAIVLVGYFLRSILKKQ